MKRHVVQYHIANHFWQIIPMMVCWLSRQFEMPAVIKQHSGMFVVEDHVGEFIRGVNSFFQFLYSEMGISSEEELLRYVWTNEILVPTSSFSSAEIQALDAYDSETKTPYLPVRSAVSPERLSSLLHWRTVHHLLLRCDLSRVPVENFQMKVQNDLLSVVIPSSSDFATSRTVEFRSKTSPIPPPASAKPCKKKSKKRRNSAAYALPREVNCSTPLFDTHCHLDRLLTPHSVEHFLLEEGVYGVVGCHPKWAHRFTENVKARIIELLQHPKVVALEEEPQEATEAMVF